MNFLKHIAEGLAVLLLVGFPASMATKFRRAEWRQMMRRSNG